MFHSYILTAFIIIISINFICMSSEVDKVFDYSQHDCKRVYMRGLDKLFHYKLDFLLFIPHPKYFVLFFLFSIKFQH